MYHKQLLEFDRFQTLKTQRSSPEKKIYDFRTKTLEPK